MQTKTASSVKGKSKIPAETAAILREFDALLDVEPTPTKAKTPSKPKPSPVQQLIHKFHGTSASNVVKGKL